MQLKVSLFGCQSREVEKIQSKKKESWLSSNDPSNLKNI